MSAEHSAERRVPPIPKWGKRSPLTLREISDQEIVDTSGRRLKELYVNGIDNQIRIAGTSGSSAGGGREGKRVHASAYVAVLKEFPKSKELISYMRGKLRPYDEPADSDDMRVVIEALVGLPLWLANRADRDEIDQNKAFDNGKVPAYVTGVTKVMRGMDFPYFLKTYREDFLSKTEDTVIPPRVSDEEPEATEEELTTAEPFVRYVFDNGLLVDEEVACPVSRRKLREIATVLFSTPIEGTNSIEDELRLSEGDIERIADFGYAFIKGDLERAYFESIISTPGNAQLFLTGPAGVEIAEDHDIPDAVARYVTRINGLQKMMNRSLGREEPSLLTSEDVYDEFAGYARKIMLGNKVNKSSP